MKRSIKDRAKGTAKEVKGKLKEATGRATGSARLQREGRTEAARGRVRRRLGELEKDLADASDF